MDNETNLPQIGADDFARRFSLRAADLMWLLGAGASAAAGVPTAGDMVREFKQQLFMSQRRVWPQAVADLSSPAIRARLQAHIDSSENLPLRGAPDEYAALFEAVYPAEVDRRAYFMIEAQARYAMQAIKAIRRPPSGAALSQRSRSCAH